MPRSYVDNSMNRSLGRVGMSVGSMPVSKGASYSGGGDGGGGGYRSSSGNNSGFSSSSFGSRNYVDNAMNRSIGRVGMPAGSMPVSRNSSSSYNSNRNNSPVFKFSSYSSDTYVDNASNRSLGRVGMVRGSVPVSTNSSSYGLSSSSSSAGDTYVDNSINRSLGRVGMAKGSIPVSRSSSSNASEKGITYRNDSGQPKSSNSSDTYVDNAYNRKVGRVGLPKGSKLVSHSETDLAPDTKRYVDNAYNRKYNRVGMPLGSKPISKTSESTETNLLGSRSKNSMKRSLRSETKVYTDNDRNRRLGRVGKPLGSMPVVKTSSTTKKTRDAIKTMEREELQDRCCESRNADYGVYEQQDAEMKNALFQALCHYNRLFEEMTWKESASSEKQPMTTTEVLEEYNGKTIPFQELELCSKIGSGGFGDVYFAKWKGSVVAVKKLKAVNVSKKRLDDFEREVMIFCKLDHPNIVKFIGASVHRPDICIVMEYMLMSLFDAIHFKDIDFTEAERVNIIQQVGNGLKYLHNLDIVHRDLKTSNVLFHYQEEEIEVKITDFGLSSMKNNIESSSSNQGEIVGTPRYSAPEILRGDRGLAVEDYKKADVYSLSLVMFEVVFEDEPFYDFNLRQLVKHVGQCGVSPEVPAQPAASESVLRVMETAWSFKPEDRPELPDMCDALETLETLYAV